MNDSTTPRVFEIPSANLATFQDRLSKLCKKAAKLNLPMPTYTIVKETTRTVTVSVGRFEDEQGVEREQTQDKAILIHHIVLHNPIVVVAGYQFLASIEHTEEGNLLRSVEGESVPAAYRQAAPNCDHCHLARKRNNTFILRHVESGRLIQVGRNCLIDFLGIDGEQYASMAELIYDANELAEASEGCSSSGFGAAFDILAPYLACVAEVIALSGWRSRSTAKEYGGSATADVAYQHYHPSPLFLKSSGCLFRVPSEASQQVAKDAIAWCEELSDAEVEASDYLHNIRIIARRGIVSARQYGFAASIVSAYQRHLGDLKRKERFVSQAVVSQHMGKVGDRSVFALTVEHVVALPDYGYGSSSLHLMSDASGNRFTWKSSSHTLETGKTYNLRGTIKGHDTYKEVKQTTLTRCEVVSLKSYRCSVCGKEYQVEAESDKDARKALLTMLQIARLPKGSLIVCV